MASALPNGASSMPTASPIEPTPSAKDREAAHAAARALLDVVPENPLRPLDWRWRLARALATRGGRPRRRWCDPWVLRALRYARALRRLGRPTHPDLMKLDPDLAAALALHAAPAGHLRLALETRLVGGQDDAAIAARTGLPAGVVAAYASVCYEARDLRPHPDALLFRALGPGCFDGTGGTRADVLKALAYRGGPAVADALLGAGPGGDAGQGDPGLAELLDLLVAVQAVPIDGRTAPALLRLHAHAAELALARAADSAAAVTGVVVLTPVMIPAEPPWAPSLPAPGPIAAGAGPAVRAADHAGPADHAGDGPPPAGGADARSLLRTG